MKFGIGDNFAKGRQVAYVLSNFNAKEFEELTVSIDKAIDMVLSFTTIGINRTMSQFND